MRGCWMIQLALAHWSVAGAWLAVWDAVMLAGAGDANANADPRESWQQRPEGCEQPSCGVGGRLGRCITVCPVRFETCERHSICGRGITCSSLAWLNCPAVLPQSVEAEGAAAGVARGSRRQRAVQQQVGQQS